MALSVQSRIRQLDAFFARAELLPQGDELRADIARYGIVLICGFVERCVEEIILDRIRKHGNVKVQNFIRSHFKRGTNYNCAKISELLGRFDNKWSTEFQSHLNSRSDIVEAIISAYEVRNSVAHGGTSSKGLSDVKIWFQSSKDLVGILEEVTRR